MKECSVDGCGGKHEAKGYCRTHYQQWRWNGDPLERKRAKRGIAQVFLNSVASMHGTVNECILWPYGRNNGYGWLSQSKSASRAILEMTAGPCPKDKRQAAHNCGNHLCVNPKHLRWATAKENASDRKAHGTEDPVLGNLRRQ